MEGKNDAELLVSIKDFSDYTGVKQSALRYYDDIGLFSPATRGENNYRYYSLSQIQSIKLIETLRELSIPLKKIEEFMDNRSPESTVELLAQRETVLTSELRKLQESFSLIHKIRTLIQNGADKSEGLFEIVFQEETRISLGPAYEYGSDEGYHRAYSSYYRAARNLRVNLGYHIGGYFDTFDEFLADPVRPKRYYSLDPNGLDVKPAGMYLVGYARGGYGDIGDLSDRMQQYAQNNTIKVIGPIYHIYLMNEVCYKDPSQYLSRVSARIER